MQRNGAIYLVAAVLTEFSYEIYILLLRLKHFCVNRMNGFSFTNKVSWYSGSCYSSQSIYILSYKSAIVIRYREIWIYAGSFVSGTCSKNISRISNYRFNERNQQHPLLCNLLNFEVNKLRSSQILLIIRSAINQTAPQIF